MHKWDIFMYKISLSQGDELSVQIFSLGNLVTK